VALFRKTGTDYDLAELKRRKKMVERRIEQTQHEKDKALLEGRIYREPAIDKDYLDELALPKWSPILIIAPNAVVANWIEDFDTWAHVSVAVYQGSGRAAALESVENGISEVLVCGDSTIQGVESFNALDSAKVKWKVIVVDEFHKFKNETKHLATNLRRMRDRHGCVVLGLTGTLMQNNHKELWNLVDIVAKDFLGPWGQFEDLFAKPIQLSRYVNCHEDHHFLDFQ
jgi:SNF2 family DNA or RNA helicase